MERAKGVEEAQDCSVHVPPFMQWPNPHIINDRAPPLTILLYGSPAVGPAELLKGPPKKHRACIILCHDEHISLAERRLLHAVHAVTAQDAGHLPEQSQH